MFKKFLATDDDRTTLILRLTLALVIFPHGAQKVLGWFGGHGFAGTLQFFTETLGLPWLLSLLVILAEFLGPIGLTVGLLTRGAAFGIFAVMVGAIVTIHGRHGFFMNWYNKPQGEGYEYHLLAIGLAVALMVKGGGAWSLDRRLTQS